MEDKRRYNPLQYCGVISLQLIKKIKKKKKKIHSKLDTREKKAKNSGPLGVL